MAQEKDSAAIVQFQNAGKMETVKMRKAKSYHNIGYICQRHQMYGEAIEAYKEALRNNPADNETRYNLALCKRQQKNQPQNQQNKNEEKKKQEKEQNEQNKDNQQKEQPKDQMSKENAEQLLNAAIQAEKETQERMKKAMQQPRSRRLQKNW